MHHMDPIYPEIQVLLKALTYMISEMVKGNVCPKAMPRPMKNSKLNLISTPFIPRFMSCPLQTVIALVPF